MMTLVACSHGTNSAAGQAAIASLVEQVAALLPDVRVVEAFVDVQEPAVDEVVARWVEDGLVVVVPLLLSTGFHTKVDIARAVAPFADAVAAPTLGPHALLAELLAARLTEAGLDAADAVVLAAAGSTDPAAGDDVRAMAALLGERLGRAVSVGFAAGAGTRIDAAVTAARGAGGRRVAIASYVLAPGFFADVIGRAGGDLVTAALAPDPRVAEVIAARFAGSLVHA